MVQMLMHSLAHFFISVALSKHNEVKIDFKKTCKVLSCLRFFSVFEEIPDTQRFRGKFRNFSVLQLPIVSSFITCERIHLANKLLSFNCKKCWRLAKLMNQTLKNFGTCYILIMSNVPKKNILGVILLTMYLLLFANRAKEYK